MIDNDPGEDRNPWQPPAVEDSATDSTRNGRATLAIVILAILALPSAAVAGFIACTGTVLVLARFSELAIILGLIVGIVAIIVVLGMFIGKIIQLTSNRKPPDSI